MGGINYCAEPESSMMSSGDGGSRMEGGDSRMHNDNSFLADAAPPPQPVPIPTQSLRHRMGVAGTRLSNPSHAVGPGSQLSSIMEGSQGDVTMSVSAWAQQNAAAPEDSKMDSTFGAKSPGSSVDRIAAGESMLSESAVIVPSRTAVRGRSDGALRVQRYAAGVSLSNPVHGGFSDAADQYKASGQVGTESPRFMPMAMGMGDNSSILEAPPAVSKPGASQAAAEAATQRSATQQQQQNGSRSSRIPRPSSLSSVASMGDVSPRAATADATPAAPSPNSRRVTDLFLPTSPSFAGDGSPGASALDSATSGVDADISAALDEESRMDFPNSQGRISNAAFKHPPGVRQAIKKQVSRTSTSRGETPKSIPCDSFSSVSAMVSTPGGHVHSSERPGTSPLFMESGPQPTSGAQWQEQSTDDLSSSFCEPEGMNNVYNQDHLGLTPLQNGNRTVQSSAPAAAPMVRTGGSSGSNSGTSGPSHALRKLGSGSPATAATDPVSMLHDSLQPPATPDKSPVPVACVPSLVNAPTSGKSAYVQTAALASTALKSIRKKANTITSLSEVYLHKTPDQVKPKAKSRTLSEYEIVKLVAADPHKRAAPSLPLLNNHAATGSIDEAHAMQAVSGDGMQSRCAVVRESCLLSACLLKHLVQCHK